MYEIWLSVLVYKILAFSPKLALILMLKSFQLQRDIVPGPRIRSMILDCTRAQPITPIIGSRFRAFHTSVAYVEVLFVEQMI